MVEHVWTVVCRQSVVDKDSNNISLLSSLEQIALNTPSEHAETNLVSIDFEVVSFWARSDPNVPSSGKAKLQYITPSKEKLGDMMFDVDLTGHSRSRNRIKMTGLSFKEAGNYYFQLQLKQEDSTQWIDVARVPIEVNFIQSAPKKNKPAAKK